jgi:hypothetical protein
VWVHTPMYSSSNGHAGGNADLRKLYEEIFVRAKVSLIFAGDDHVYERSFPRFQENVLIPSPSDVLGTDTLITDAKVMQKEKKNLVFCDVKFFSILFHLRLALAGSTWTVGAVRSDRFGGFVLFLFLFCFDLFVSKSVFVSKSFPLNNFFTQCTSRIDPWIFERFQN